MAPSFRKHWKSVYQAKQNLYGLPFQTIKKKWAWAKDKKNPNQSEATFDYPFKFENTFESSPTVVNALPKSVRFLFPIRREYGVRLRAKQATKAS